VCSLSSLNTNENFVRRFQCRNRQGRYFKLSIGNERLNEISNDKGD
jgi:hypothetical protein